MARAVANCRRQVHTRVRSLGQQAALLRVPRYCGVLHAALRSTMKTLLALLLTALSCHAQYATLVCRAYQNGMIVTNSMAVLEVAAGKVIEITDWRTYGSATNIHMRVAQQVGLWVVGSTNYPTNV